MTPQRLIQTVLVMLLCARELLAAQSGSWTREEMGARGELNGTLLKLRLLPDQQAFPAEFYCKDKPSSCEFELAYFVGEGFDPSKKGRLNILYIPGGPGAIVDPSHRTIALRVLQKKHNIVYFHPRGAAQSAIDRDISYDRFLRADYVVEDIEKLRQAVLKDKPWDAIYAHSWGTVIAQRYAKKYGKPADSVPKVLSLMLSGPVDRHLATHGARTKTTIENLRLTLEYYRSRGAGSCQCQSTKFLKPLVTDFSDPQISTYGGRVGVTDDFCFLTAQMIDQITQQLGEIIPYLEANYGSADFVVDHFKTLEDDKEFQTKYGKFPKEFFVALRYLQMSGAPDKNSLVFMADSRDRVNAALLVAYYLAAEKTDRCRAKEPLFRLAGADCEFCERLKAAKTEQLDRLAGGWESRRANYVYGVYDGVSRWLPVMMEENGCFTGGDIEKFAKGSSGEKRFGRDQAKRIGIVAEEKICPWNPADHTHEVPTLLLKGSRDAIVAGCQAEAFFTYGLKNGRRVLLEFRGMGHDMSVGNLFEASDPSPWSKSFAALLEDFAKMSANISRFRSDSGVRARIKKLKATDRTAATNLMNSCQ
jgi:pimeloyl-ACP methyl ester carboxylesterase